MLDLFFNTSPVWSWLIIAGLFFALDLGFKSSPFIALGLATIGTAMMTGGLALSLTEQTSAFLFTSWMATAWWWMRNQHLNEGIKDSLQTKLDNFIQSFTGRNIAAKN